jgi:cytoskeletal protein RodZ
MKKVIIMVVTLLLLAAFAWWYSTVGSTLVKAQALQAQTGQQQVQQTRDAVSQLNKASEQADKQAHDLMGDNK